MNSFQLVPAVAFSAFLSVQSVSFAADSVSAVVNPGFEKGLEGWKVRTDDPAKASATVTREAAKSGSAGLQVQDDSDTLDVTVSHNARFPVSAGKTYAVTFQGRSWQVKRSICVYIRFFDAKGVHLPPPTGLRHLAEIDAEIPEWKEYAVSATAPEGATEMDLYVRTNKRGVGKAHLDDFVFSVK